MGQPVLTVAFMAATWLHGEVPKFKITPNVDRSVKRVYRTGEQVTPPDVWHLAEGGGLPGRLWFKLAPDDAGGWICTVAEIEGASRPLTTSTLRSIPLSQIVQQLLTMRFGKMDRGGPLDLLTGHRTNYDKDRWSLSDLEARGFYLGNAPRPAAMKPQARRGGAGPTTEDLRRFGEAYRWALTAHRDRPVAAAAERMKIGRSTAHRWLKLIKNAEERA
jgi:hypothetical protein